MKAAVVGLGPHGRRVLAVLRSMAGIDVDAVVDVRPEVLASVELPAGTRRFASAEDLWREGSPALVCIVTNGPSHSSLAIGSIRGGARYVMVEKPMACSLAECDAMIEAAASAGARLSVNQSRRHHPFYRWLRESCGSGILGAPRTVWIQRPGIGLGCLATHSFDLACFLIGMSPAWVTAWVDEPAGNNPRGSQFVDPGGLVVMDFGGKVRAVVAQNEDGAGPTSIELDFTSGRVRIDEKTGAAEILRRPAKAEDSVGTNSFVPVPLPEGLSPRLDMHQMTRGVIGELVSEGPMDCNGAHGRLAVEVLVAAYLSSERGNCPIPMPLTEKGDLDKWLPVT